MISRARAMAFQRIARFRRRVYEILEQAMPDDRVSRYVHAALVALTVGSVGSVVFESVPDYALKYDAVFLGIELVTVAVFTLEYILRLWIAPIHPPYR